MSNMVTKEMVRFEFPRDMVSCLQEGLCFHRVIAINSIFIDGVEYKNLDFEKQVEKFLRKEEQNATD